MSKVDNSKGAKAAKVTMRRNVLAAVPHPRVFDAFSGLGEMWGAAWKDADEYLGCDERPLSLTEPHRRLVCDNRLALRTLDLSRFNVFDFDAYGQPWEQMLILAHRRRWASGEVGAVVLTDGSSLHLRYGSTSAAMAQMLGTSGKNLPRTISNGDKLQRLLLRRWCSLANVEPRRSWLATGRGSSTHGKGQSKMVYTALVFAGR